MWVTGALLTVIIFLNTTHVLISKNSDFCEADEDVDEFLKRNNVLVGLPESTLSFGMDIDKIGVEENDGDNDGNVTKIATNADSTDRKSRKTVKKLPKKTTSTKMVQSTNTVMTTPMPSSGNVLVVNDSGKSEGIRSDVDDFWSSADKNIEPTAVEKLPLSPRTTSTVSASTTSTSTITTSTITTSTMTKIYFMDKLTSGSGRWRQVKTVGLDEFLEAEGGNWIYRNMASAAIPDFIYTKKGEKYVSAKNPRIC